MAVSVFGPIPPAENILMSRSHGLIELVCLVHLVGVGLLRIEPSLEEFRVVLRQGLISLLDLTQLKLQRRDLVV